MRGDTVTLVTLTARNSKVGSLVVETCSCTTCTGSRGVLETASPASPASPSDRRAALARAVARLAPSHRDPEKFHADKSEIAAALRRLAREIAA